MTEVKKCLLCSAQVSGRMDKKFCSDRCRNNYNNRWNSNLTNYVRRVNLILKKNRRILESKTGHRQVSELLMQGFDFNYFTQTVKTKNSNQYFYCYDYGYLMLEDRTVIVVKKTI